MFISYVKLYNDVLLETILLESGITTYLMLQSQYLKTKYLIKLK